MPSNTMKISQLVAQLQQVAEAHGDLDVVLSVGELSAAVAVDGRNVNVARELPYVRLPVPALVIGLWQDETGKLRASPGQVYQHTPDEAGEEWNYNRGDAPVDTELVVWKRYLGQDRGFCNNDGDWFVYEAGDKPVQIIPAGVLGWRLP